MAITTIQIALQLLVAVLLGAILMELRHRALERSATGPAIAEKPVHMLPAVAATPAMRFQPTSMPDHTAERGQVQLLQRGAGGDWIHHSFRVEGHPDIDEALATPGLAIRRDGAIEEGIQC